MGLPSKMASLCDTACRYGYFTYAYNKDSYKNKKNSKKSSKHRILKIYKD